jgi:hypothetical protein
VKLSIAPRNGVNDGHHHPTVLDFRGSHGKGHIDQANGTDIIAELRADHVGQPATDFLEHQCPVPGKYQVLVNPFAKLQTPPKIADSVGVKR